MRYWESIYKNRKTFLIKVLRANWMKFQK